VDPGAQVALLPPGGLTMAPAYKDDS